MKNKIVSLIFLFMTIFYIINLNADCASCDDFLDTGLCNRSDLNNKFCSIGSPKDCYPGFCDSPIE